MSLPWLHIDGKWIRDEAGNRIALRGVGCDYTAYRKWDWLEEFIQQIAGRGYNHVRLAFTMEPFHAHHVPYQPDWMDIAVDLCEQYGIYAVLTCMDWWASPEHQGWEEPLPLHEQDWLNMWKEIAERYKDRSVVAAYELYNEPLGSGLTPDGKNQVDCYLDAMAVIREVDTKHPFIVYEDSHNLFHTLETEAGIADRLLWHPNTVRTDTIYASHHWWAGKDLPEDFAEAYRQAVMYVEGLKYYSDWLGVCVWAGEFGTYDYGDYSHANWEYVREVIRLCEEVGISWDYWQMEAFKQYAPEALIYITPTPYTTNVYSPDVPRQTVSMYGLQFPRPFNLWNHVMDKFWAIGGVEQHRWGSTWMSLPGSVFWVVLSGPISIRRKVWGGPDKYNYPLISDEVIIIPEGETARIEGGAGYTEIYAEEDLAEKIFHSLTVETNPISGVPFTLNKVS